MRYGRLGVLLLGFLCAHAAQGPRIVFVGLKSGGAPAFEQRLEQQIRRGLSSMPGTQLAGPVETQRLIRFLQQKDPYTTSERALASRDDILNEPSILLWGVVDNVDVQIVRRKIFGAAAVGQINVALSALDTASVSPRFVGIVHAQADVALPPIGFSPIDKKAHLPAPKRVELIRRLNESAARQVVDLLTALVRSWSDENILYSASSSSSAAAQGGADPSAEPTVSDLFDIPGMDSAPVIPGAEQQLVDTTAQEGAETQPAASDSGTTVSAEPQAGQGSQGPAATPDQGTAAGAEGTSTPVAGGAQPESGSTANTSDAGGQSPPPAAGTQSK